MRLKWITPILLLTLGMIISSSCKKQKETTRQQSTQAHTQQIEQLLSKMTLREKIGQMAQMHYWSDGDTLPEKFKQRIKEGSVGSLLNVDDIHIRNKLQKIAVEESPHGIPIIFGKDVIHGYKTVFPVNIGLSCTWNPEMVKKTASIAAKEAYAKGVDWTFAPMCDITFDPRWGRIAETNGEDPYLTGEMITAMIEGFQGKDIGEPYNIAACAKHYVGYGATVDGRDYNTTFIPEVRLHNVHLPPFKKAVEAGVSTVMSGFNDLNGIPATGNQHAIRDILKDKYGFEGFLVSDWASVQEMIPHGYCKNEEEAAAKAVQAGTDMEMASETFINHLDTLVKEGIVSEEQINEAVRRILRIKYKLGLFEQPYRDTTDQSVLLNKKHKQWARKITRQSIVMLKNQNQTLPLSNDPGKVAIIGPLADAEDEQLGTWAPNGEGKHTITPLMALEDSLCDNQLLYAPAFDSCRDDDRSGFSEALQAARQADVVLMFMGESADMSGESKCRAFLDLPNIQEELIKKVSKAGKPVILTLMSGRPLILQEVKEYADAILYAWHPGTMGGPALTDLIFGKVSPSGKLTQTFPRAEGQIPIYYAHKNQGRPPEEKRYNQKAREIVKPQGYSCNYLDLSVAPAYPFGYGLSYTDFKYSNLKISKDTLQQGTSFTASVMVKNTGNYQGDEIVQLYIRDLVASVTRPVKELKGFRRISLDKDESQTVTFEINANDLGFYNKDGQYIVEPGQFNLWIGPRSTKGLKTAFVVQE